jgi:serine/threonine-protein kinase HipA
MRRQLEVRMNQNLVGILSENTGIWSFTYEDDWVREQFPLAPGLPLQHGEIIDTGTVRPVQWFFDNLLPEEAARTQLVNNQTSPEKVDAWYLLEQFGAESAGAISLLPLGKILSEGGLSPLSDEELELRIQAMPRQPLSAKAPKKMSIAGAQQKLLVVVGKDGKLYEPVGNFASTHILKPDVTSDHYPCSAVNEWFCASLSKNIGLNVPDVELRFVPSPVYIIRRFDRDLSTDPVTRLHALDAMQMLSLSAGTKYVKSGVESLVEISEQVRTRLESKAILFRWTLFNILIGNSDAHLKNLSLFAGKNGYALAPHYDLLSTASWSTPDLVGPGELVWPNIELSYPFGGARTYADLQRDHMYDFGMKLGIPESMVKREHKKMAENILPAATRLLENFEARTDIPNEKRGAYIQMLRRIIYLCISENLMRLTT